MPIPLDRPWGIGIYVEGSPGSGSREGSVAKRGGRSVGRPGESIFEAALGTEVPVKHAGTTRAVALAAVLAFMGSGCTPEAAVEEEEKNLARIIQATTEGTGRERREALGRIAAVRDREAIRQWDIIGKLEGLAGDDDLDVARNAVKVLAGFAELGGAVRKQSLGALVRILRNADVRVDIRGEAVVQLGARAEGRKGAAEVHSLCTQRRPRGKRDALSSWA